MLCGCVGELIKKITVDFYMKLEKGKSVIIFIRTFGSVS